MKTKATVVILAAAIIQGCGGTASCGSGKAMDTVASILNEQVSTTNWGQKLLAEMSDIRIENVQTVIRNEENDSYVCEAVHAFSFRGREYQLPVTYTLTWMEDKSDTMVTVQNAGQIRSRYMELSVLGR